MNRIFGSVLSVWLLAAAGCNRGQVASVEAAGDPAAQTSQSGRGRVASRSGPRAVLAPEQPLGSGCKRPSIPNATARVTISTPRWMNRWWWETAWWSREGLLSKATW